MKLFVLKKQFDDYFNSNIFWSVNSGAFHAVYLRSIHVLCSFQCHQHPILTQFEAESAYIYKK